jgi:serine/threonine-protein kinase
VAIPVVPTPIEPPSAQPPPSLVNTARAPTRRPAEAFQGIREKPGQKLRGAVGAGTLTLDTTPWAEVFLEGKRLGTTPLYEAKLPAGRHRLRLWNPDAKSERVVEVVIVDGQLTTRKIAW